MKEISVRSLRPPNSLKRSCLRAKMASAATAPRAAAPQLKPARTAPRAAALQMEPAETAPARQRYSWWASGRSAARIPRGKRARSSEPEGSAAVDNFLHVTLV